MKTINDLLEFYNFEVDENDNLFLIKDGVRQLVPIRTFYLFEHKREGLTKEDAQALVDEGKAMYVSKYEIIGAIKNYSEEEIFKLEHRYGFRTDKYIKAIFSNLGYVDSTGGWDEPAFIDKPVVIGKFGTFFSNSDILLGKVESGLYCASFSYPLPPDDYCIEQHFFTKNPSEKDVLTVYDVKDLLFKFETRKSSEIFNCWECGCTTHWLDIEGDLRQKLSQLEDKYCGC